MPKSHPSLIHALGVAIDRLKSGTRYEWGHVGHCNCGHLVQAAFEHSPDAIYHSFGEGLGEWSEHGNLRCEMTGLPVDDILENLRRIGFERQDVHHLENLSDPKVLSYLPEGKRHLQRNRREDVIHYLTAMRALLNQSSPGVVASLCLVPPLSN